MILVLEREITISPHVQILQFDQRIHQRVIFSDGIESDFAEFNSGATAVILPSKRQGILVV
jgi:hypothetical protein